MKKLCLIAAFLIPLNLFAASVLERAGDILQFAVPAYALGMTAWESDWDGSLQLAESYGATIATSTLLKYSVNATRPNGGGHSFPSGHTASAFSGATFIHRRYGWRRAALPYAAAALTGVSRIAANAHYVRDVVAGAAIAGAFSYLLADWRGVAVGPNSIRFNFRF